MAVDLGVFDRQKTIVDQQQLQQAFELKKALAQQQMLKSMQPGGGNLPAALQLANEVQRLEASGQPEAIAQAARIREFAKTNEKGLVSDGMGGVTLQPGFIPAASAIAGAKAGAQANAKNQSELNYKPQITAADTSAKIRSEAQTDSAIALPKYLDDVNNAILNIDNLVGNESKGIPQAPGLNAAVGPFDTLVPTLRDDTAAFENRLKQIQSQTFLDAFEKLRGGGAITEKEGEKATSAYNRMTTATSESDFIDASKEYRSILVRGAERAKAKAASPTALDVFGSQMPQGDFNQTLSNPPVNINSGWSVRRLN